MVDATLRTHKFHDLSHFGLRISVGVLLIVHSLGKFSSGGAGFFSSIGLPPEMALLIGLLESIGGALLVAGVLTRIAASLLAMEMLVIMIHIKKLQAFSGPNGLELDLLVFVIVLTVAVLGPGRISISHAVKKLPRFLQ
ncbi:DoxX family protein [Nitrosotalea devaniterrae]|uniref:DoxX family protein n=4 Tax=cellular organisms TaxID=131567 RepID=A0A128A2D3_9ARCH|nr:DoxX family protein [Candidatus Nitrosotalea devanaterra]